METRRTRGMRDSQNRVPRQPRTSRPPRDEWHDWDDADERDQRETFASIRASRALQRVEPRVPAPVTRSERAVAPRPRRGSVDLPTTGGVLVPGTRKLPAVTGMVPVTRATKAARPHWRKRMPIWIAGNAVAIVILAMLFVAPSMTSAAAASACGWYSVKAGDTLRDIGTANNTTGPAIASANHISANATLYVGQKLCIPNVWYASAKAKPYVPSAAQVALPPGILAGEFCTADRSIVWTGTIGRWTIPPGCFGKIYYPNPANYMVNGHEIGGFGWCNWWPEALLRNPNALDKPPHSQVRIGVPVFWAPQPPSTVGHYGFVESIGQGKYAGWILISEMNMYWRGGGWAKVDYRYIRVDYPGAEYLY
jgi:LysM repeat protein